MAKIQKNVMQSKSIFDIPQSIIPPDNRVFYPDWTNTPPPPQNVVTLNLKRVLTTGNLMTIVSRAGTGKTSVMFALLSNIINPKCDSFGFATQLNSFRKKVLYIDTEQTQQDTWKNWSIMCRRAGIDNPEIDNRIIVANFKAISIKERMSLVEDILNKNNDIGLVLFDGAGDFIQDTNSIQESGAFIDWINTFNPNISIISTIHTNPDGNKPRGHIGSELCRRSESVLLIRRADNEGIREITTKFDYGKVRGDNDQIESYFTFSEDDGMFISCDYEKPNARSNEKSNEYEIMIKEIFNGQTVLSSKYIISKIAEKTSKLENTCKTTFYRHIDKQFLTKTQQGYEMLK